MEVVDFVEIDFLEIKIVVEFAPVDFHRRCGVEHHLPDFGVGHGLQVIGRYDKLTVEGQVHVKSRYRNKVVGYCAVIYGEQAGKHEAARGAPFADAIGTVVGADIDVIGGSWLNACHDEGVGVDIAELRRGARCRYIVGVLGVENIPVGLVAHRLPAEGGSFGANVARRQIERAGEGSVSEGGLGQEHRSTSRVTGNVFINGGVL